MSKAGDPELLAPDHRGIVERHASVGYDIFVITSFDRGQEHPHQRLEAAHSREMG
jgi:hypothetical protein